MKVNRSMLCAAGAALALACAVSAAQADGASPGEVERISQSAFGDTAPALPRASAGRDRTWTQIVWDASANRLARRTYRFWDPLGSDAHDIAWSGGAASRATDGPLAGDGLLVWRTAGSAPYDESARIATYSGEMAGGRANGRGTYTHKSGVAYSGEWTDGLMEGEGRLYLPNGDQYTGSFRAGRPGGEGVYIDATGTLYQGGFLAGLREGQGSLYPATGKAFVADWKAGQPLAGTLRYLAPEEQVYPPLVMAKYQAYDDIRIGVLVDRTFYAHVPSEQPAPLRYAADSRRDVLEIQPDDKRVMEAWRGKASVAMTQDEEQDYETSSHGYKEGESVPLGAGFLATADRLHPVPVVFEMRNDSRQPLRIVNAFLDVADSRTDNDPAVHMRFGYVGDCGMLTEFKADFDLENFGWTAPRNAALRFSFANAPSREFTKKIGDIDPVAKVDLSDEIRSLGYPVDTFKAGPLACGTGEDGDVCLKRAIAERRFGDLSDHVEMVARHVLTPVTGFLDYEWTDSQGKAHAKSSPFSMNIVIARLEWEAECGEGGMPEMRQMKPFEFALEKQDYRIMVPLRDDIPPGVTGRWRVRLQAPKSSNHEFRIVFELADGRQVASRPIHFTFFKPKSPE